MSGWALAWRPGRASRPGQAQRLLQPLYPGCRQLRGPALRPKSHRKLLVDGAKFFRKGIIGDWKNVMTEEQAAFIDERVRELYDPIGLNFYA